MQASSTRPEFVRYYEEASESEATRRRFLAVRDSVLRVLAPGERRLDVADVGCGAGTQAMLWAELGHRVHGVDISRELIAVALRRATEGGFQIDLRAGSAVSLPWPDASMDVCLVPELLEHVVEWQACLDEFTRILRPGGALFLSTTNRLCPRQQEYSLPLYSWYPARVKRYCEHLARTTRPGIAGYATFPAVNWFTFYELRRELGRRGFRSVDRFDVKALGPQSRLTATVLAAVRGAPPLRWLAHVATPYTMLVATKARG